MSGKIHITYISYRHTLDKTIDKKRVQIYSALDGYKFKNCSESNDKNSDKDIDDIF